ncbi:hypothetical protein GCK72_012713 [Caenorhabditis remanei]|uniref:CUT domain-containing protein n=1 Tax=Caenorhabditis remanei TaxID=31234 RepID=A0A6A5GLQ6_CAERE|nr:hypothetical protein GCK72_012713 [Caenorhabditis remanei]KAF1756260.1 hypothetical protein GCK72_012713 [Caenorhabditis remanei]
MSDSNPPAEPNRNRKRKSDASSDTPSSSSRPPQPVPVSSGSSAPSSSSITVENVIGTLRRPLGDGNLDEDKIAAKILKFTEKYGEKKCGDRKLEMKKPFMETIREEESHDSSNTPSSSSRPPQPVPISSGSSTQSSSSITVDEVIVILSTPLEGRNLNVKNIAEKVLKFTVEYGEKVAASIGKTWSTIRTEMEYRIHPFTHANRQKEISEKEQIPYLRLTNWFEYYEESKEKEAVLNLHKKLYERWEVLALLDSNTPTEPNRNRKRKSDSSLNAPSSSSRPPQLVPISSGFSAPSSLSITVKDVILTLCTRLEGRNFNVDKIAEKVLTFTKEYGLKVAASIGQNWDIVREEMNLRLAVQYKDMEEEKQIMYLRLFNWLAYYEDSQVKEEVLNLHLELNERWLEIKYEKKWKDNLTIYGVWKKLRKPLGIRTIDVEDVIARVNRFTEPYRKRMKRIAPSIGKSYATFTHQMAHPSGKRYEEMTPGLQELYVRLFNWLELYKEEWQRVSVLQMHKELWREWSEKEEEKQKERTKWIVKSSLNNFHDAHRFDLGLD